MKKTFLFIGIVFLLFTSCTVEPQEIAYGTDVCYSCKMTIVDKTHAAEIVTKKGRAQKYDAIECMLRDMAKNDQDSYALYLITDYMTPAKLVDATKATYLISQEIKSPMGAFLSGFEDKQIAESTKQEKGGLLYDWTAIQKEIGSE